MKILNATLCILLMSVIVSSCKKEFISKEQPAPYFFTTDKEKSQVEINIEIAAILQEVYNNRKAFYEVTAAIYSAYYEDESVLLRDLLMPESSPLYKTEKFKQFRAEQGTFKREFYEVLNKGEYPHTKQQLYGPPNREIISSVPEQLSLPTPTDTSKEIFSKTNGVCIYFPYSENFGSVFSTAYFDNINTNPRGKTATIVAADREADTGPGQEPYLCGTRDLPKLCYRTVTVSDDYAELNATHIVSVGAEIADLLPNDPPPPPGIQVERVYNGHCRVSHQLDRLIGLSNKGGPDIKVARVSGYLQMVDQQVTTFASDITSLHFKRKDVRKGRFKRDYSVWDPFWQIDNKEQVYAIWEDDTKGTKTFTGSLVTTVTASPGNTVVQTIGFNVTVSTQDEILTQRKQDRYSYFRDALNNQGCGYVVDNNDFLPAGVDWPLYDCGSIWTYTWPFRRF